MSPAWAADEPNPAPQRIEIQGERPNDQALRRRSTAAKIIVGRDEIEQFGDATVGELLKRLPGVTLQGAPGRGGQIRMRGLGNGYTQILLDGERVQGGLSLDSINPDQIERIEIIRAPTAETGARAIGGTINIVTREGFQRQLNDLRLGVGLEAGRPQPSASWSRDGRLGSLAGNVSLSAQASDRDDNSTVHTFNPTDDRTERLTGREWRQSLHLTSRLQWRDDDGSTWTLMPLWVQSQGTSRRSSGFAPGALGELPYASSATTGRNEFSLGRLNGQWRGNLGDGRLELRGGVGEARNTSHNLRTELGASDLGGADALYDDRTRAVERTATANAKYSLLLDNDHSLVAGQELELAHRDEDRRQTLNGSAVNSGFGETLQARSLRSAFYAQDEWDINPHWAAHAGLRWEGIATRGEQVDGQTADNRSRVWTPLLHGVWKPEPKGPDQVRLSLTRSYRAPALSSLMGGTWRAKGENSPTNPDRSGNPTLRPELATGVDLAYERYLPAGGLFSVNLFQRRIQDLMRTLTTLQSQPDGSQRYVAQPQNLGGASTRGIELEAKFRLSALWPDWPAVDVRSNLSLYRSRVNAVPGPNNRLDQQPGASANLGADYRLLSLPLTVGGNLNWTPGYASQLSDSQSALQAGKRVLDGYLMWQLQAGQRLRLSLSNAAPQTYTTAQTVGDETATTRAQTAMAWRLQWEQKL